MSEIVCRPLPTADRVGFNPSKPTTRGTSFFVCTLRQRTRFPITTRLFHLTHFLLLVRLNGITFSHYTSTIQLNLIIIIIILGN